MILIIADDLSGAAELAGIAANRGYSAEVLTKLDPNGNILWEKDYPDDPEPFLLRGRLNEVLLSWSDASDAYRRAATLDPESVDARFGLAKSLVKQSSLDEAQTHLGFVLDKQPSHREAELLLINVLVK